MHRRLHRASRGLALLAALAGLSACGIANPWPTAPPPSRSHHVLLVVGDSLAGQTDATLPGVLAAENLDVTVIDAHRNGSGLIGPVGDRPDALGWVTEVVTAHPEVDTVLIEWAGACAVCGSTVGAVTYPEIGTPAFFDLWRANAHSLIDYLHGLGKTVVWVESPPIGVDSDTAASGSAVRVTACLVLSWIDMLDFAPYAAKGGPIGDVDWYEALSDTSGRYQTLLSYDGVIHTVRTDDLTHFTVDGSTRASTWTAHGLGELWDKLPAPAPSPASADAAPAPRLVEAGDPVEMHAAPGL